MRHADVSTPLALIVCRFLLWMVKQIDAPVAEFFESLAKLTRERERVLLTCPGFIGTRVSFAR